MTKNGSASDTVSPVASGQERRGRIEETIAKLVDMRQQVLVTWGRLAGLRSFEEIDFDDEDEVTQEKKVRAAEVRTFLQMLMDYTALGHFEIYQRIIEGKERRQAVRDAADRVYTGIAASTEVIVRFNDKYDRFAATDEELATFDTDISELGEALANRGELEDEILSALRKKKAPVT
ncbi:Rsd/AlgQ family anti-sigma factor [Granulosicoccaceae sp. 1_MG-2023]|nr:Rsd/AlgQ family anti-sigma factor [Granulosicoccaceae sp. 1_MG-2023]